MPNSKQSGATPEAGKEKRQAARRSHPGMPLPSSRSLFSTEASRLQREQPPEEEVAELEQMCSRWYLEEAETLIRVLIAANRILGRGDLKGSSRFCAMVNLLMGTVENLSLAEKRTAEVKSEILQPIKESGTVKVWEEKSSKLLQCNADWFDAWRQFIRDSFRDKYSLRIESPEAFLKSLGAVTDLHGPLASSRGQERLAWGKVDRSNLSSRAGAGLVADRDDRGNVKKTERKSTESTPVGSGMELSEISLPSDQLGRNAYAKQLIGEIGLNQTELAKETGKSQSFLSKITTGDGNATVALIKHLEFIRKKIRGGVPSSEQKLITELNSFPGEQQNAVADLTVAFMRRLHAATTGKK